MVREKMHEDGFDNSAPCIVALVHDALVSHHASKVKFTEHETLN